ncbi:ATP-grasp domain-containing protein [Pseudoalteromonas luteoviolacea]|uniref:ATP-grasp domain-containing protein n=1 Tax=Pseudoalteromonas luteoviolacea NCIMB 1942 TaxID=1365253 RepID=A0A167HSG3_9GAMM|nr:ATP-grasp domain-containing protein [Pseudoalteromonas luteoviolacea]KZN58477.1 hypothetical protein N482_21945 [Pseudoalteromonas luteoviolacea NCIMB 1942]
MPAHVYWAHLDPEASWNCANNLSLPSPMGAKSALHLALLDEIFVPARSQDVALTMLPKCQVLHEYHVSLGGSYRTQSVFKSTEAWLAENKPSWPDVFSSIAQSLGPRSHFSAVNELLSSHLQTSYAYLPIAPAASEQTLPDLNAIQFANSKSTITQLCQQLEIPCSGMVIEQQNDLHKLQKLDYPYVLKEAFGVSGRGAYLVKESRITERLLRHFRKQIDNGKHGGLIAQPWLDIEIDFSSQWRIDSNGEIRFLGLCQVVNTGFRFAGIDLCCNALMHTIEQSQYFEQVRLLLSALFKHGYFGPVCVDSAILKDGTIYPVIEVNARESMGSIAMRWQQKLSLNEDIRLRQYDVQYQSALQLEDILSKLSKRGALFNSEDGIVPLTAASLLLPTNSNLSKGRWVQLECSAQNSECYRKALSACLSEVGASLL